MTTNPPSAAKHMIATKVTALLATGDDATLNEAAELLRAGQLVVVPTETVYGLAGDGTSPAAVAEIYRVKGRPSFNPLILHCASAEHAKSFGVFNEAAQRLAATFWPGPLTLVVPKRMPSPIADLATAGLDTIALRVTGSPSMRELAHRAGRPLAAPSANKSGRLSPTTAEAVTEQLLGEVPLILDGGPSGVGVESTVIACLGPESILLRPGGLATEDITEALGAPIVKSSNTGQDPIRSPGVTLAHYAPRTPIRIEVTDIKPGDAALLFGSTPPNGLENASLHRNLSAAGNLSEAAANLFSYLRYLDLANTSCIAVQAVPENGLGIAINDRLRRAANATRQVTR